MLLTKTTVLIDFYIKTANTACNNLNLYLFFVSFSGTANRIECTCVLESDFGFIVNCNFKKSGLFRVRNLGGLKAHFGLGKCYIIPSRFTHSFTKKKKEKEEKVP